MRKSFLNYIKGIAFIALSLCLVLFLSACDAIFPDPGDDLNMADELRKYGIGYMGDDNGSSSSDSTSPNWEPNPIDDGNAGAIAIPVLDNWLVNGIPQKFDAFLINDENYVKLRDVAAALNGTVRQFSVGMYANKRIPLTTGLLYTQIGGELTGGSKKEKEYILSSDKLVLDEKEIDIVAYKIDDTNYFRLRSLGDVLQFAVGYDPSSKSVTIRTPEREQLAPKIPDAEYPVKPRKGDTDGDGIPDDWEINGADINGDGIIDLPLKEWGCNPDVPDIFVEIDWMVIPETSGTDSVSLQPSQRAMRMVFDAFWQHGIQLHIDAGPESVDFVTGKKWGTQSGGEIADYVALFPTGPEPNYPTWSRFVNPLMSSDRRSIFHHALFINQYDCPGYNRRSSGLSMFPNDGQYFLVATQMGTDRPISADKAIAGTFMHELGHNLGLRHGGDSNTNYKPNYLSVMNYAFQFDGLIGTSQLNYSEWLLPTLDENALHETKGIDPLGLTKGTGLGSWIKGIGMPVFNIAFSPIDFDGKDGISTDRIRSNINGEGGTLLTGFKDWGNIVFTGGGIGGAGIEYSASEEGVGHELTIDEALENGILGHKGAGNVMTLSPVKIIEGVPNQNYFLKVINLSNQEATFKLYVENGFLCSGFDSNITVAGSTQDISYEIVSVPLIDNPKAGSYKMVCRLVYPDREDVVVQIPINVYTFTENDMTALRQDINSGNMTGVLPLEVLNQLTTIANNTTAVNKSSLWPRYGIAVIITSVVLLVCAFVTIFIIKKKKKPN